MTPQHLPVLVIAPKRVTETVWPEEVRKWRPDLSIAVARGIPAQRAKALASGADIVAISRDNCHQVDPQHVSYRTVVLDELSSFKGGHKSRRWRAAKKLTAFAKYTWGLTGTPSPNGLLPLWPQIFLLDRGKRLGKTVSGFRTRYFTPGRRLPNGTIIEWKPKPGTPEKIHRLIDDICLSMSTDGRIELPPVTINPIAVQLPDRIMQAYEDLKHKLIADLRDLVGGEIHTAATHGVLATKLSQVTAGFIYSDEANPRRSTWMHDVKIDALGEVIEAVDSPLLVFYQFNVEKVRILEKYPQAVSIGEDDAIERWNRGEIPVLLAHPASAGHGLNLQYGGHTICWTTLAWDLELWQQGNKRLARQGQKHPVVIHALMAEDSVDHLIYQRLQDKADVQNALLYHLEDVI